jgi:N-acetyl-gamma-glutamyl-phosphate reductase
MTMEMVELRVAVLGASGFAGGELVRLLLDHPEAAVTYLGASGSVGSMLADVHPHLASVSAPLFAMDPEAVASAADVAVAALPHGASASLLPILVERGMRVVDLGGDFRLPADAYPEWYGFEHPAPAWVEKAVYGVPELFAAAIAGAHLVANPGCFPTPVLLGVVPLLAAGLVEPCPLRVDGKTGLSGAGRSPTPSTTFAATHESVRPYRLPRHQHTPEIERGIELATGMAVAVSFVPHLVPAVRGVLTTTYASLAPGVTTEDLTACLDGAYAGCPFVRVLPLGDMADSKRTRGSNMVELQAVADPRTGTAIVVGALDNLIKGAAGQAIQNLNLMHGLPEAAGLPSVAVVP